MKKAVRLTSLFLIVIMTMSFASCGALGGISLMAGILGALPSDMEWIPEYDDVAPDNDVVFDNEDTEKETVDRSEILDSMDTVFGDGGNITDVTLAAANGLRSAVSVYASFGLNGNSAGSGVIYQLDGEKGNAFIITNYHVVYNNVISSDIRVLLFGMEFADYAVDATFVGGSPNYDIAILFVQNSELLKEAAKNGTIKAVTVSNSDAIIAGQTAIAIGNPESSGIAVTSGIVSVDSEYIQMTSINGTAGVEFRVIRIDTAVNSGNSGGGLFNDNGELMGIVNAKITKSDVENIGYAIPSNVVRAISDNIIDYCFGTSEENVNRAMLGLTVTSGDVYSVYDKETGLLIQAEQVIAVETVEGSLADGVFKANDVIKSITIGEKTINVTRKHHLIDNMLDARVGDTVSFKIIREGKEMSLQVTITENCLTKY